MSDQPSNKGASPWLELASRIALRMRTVAGSRTVQSVVLLVALPLFAAALAFAWREAEITLTSRAILPLAVVVGLVPPSMGASAWQLRAMTKAGGAGIGWWTALRVVTLGSLSNLLPMSSGAVIRGGAVVYAGVSARATGKVLAYDAVVWTALSLIYSGGAALFLRVHELGISMMAGGGLLIPLGWMVGRRLRTDGGRMELVVARGAGILLQVLRLEACFLALGHSVTFVEVSTLAAASPLASIFFFLPGALGVREAFTSAVGAVIGLSAAGAFLAAALNRLVGLSVLLAWEGLLLLRPDRSTKEKP